MKHHFYTEAEIDFARIRRKFIAACCRLKIVIPCAFALALATCSTAQLNEFRDSTDVSVGVTGAGVTAAVGTRNGRKFADVSVDAKQVKAAIDQR